MQLKSLFAITLLAGSSVAHYANMGLDNVSCYIYNGIKGTENGHMIVRLSNGTWYDSNDLSNRGSITVVRLQKEYDDLPTKTKVGIVCAPDDVDTTEIGIPYVEMEPTDEDFYKDENTLYETSQKNDSFSGPVAKPQLTCIIRFCRNTAN